jgi:hypothetical protein
MAKKDMSQLEQRFLEGIGEYWGQALPASIEVYQDPKVAECFALRTFQKDGTEYRWLVCYFRNEWTAKDIADNLEELELEDEDGNIMPWPPVSGKLSFF